VIDPNEPVLEGIAAIKIEGAAGSDGVAFGWRSGSGMRSIRCSKPTSIRNIPADRAGHPFRIDF